ncbi:MAG: hypothetical protein ACM3NT_05995 [Methylocystaceae bacterium]
MLMKDTVGVLIGWVMLSVLAAAVTVVRFINHTPFLVSLIITILMFLVLVYLLILRWIDGPSFLNSANDERLWRISANAQRLSFWFLFISTWCLAAIIEFFNPVLLKQYISFFLASMGTVGLFIYMFSFIWQKYRVYDQ